MLDFLKGKKYCSVKRFSNFTILITSLLLFWVLIFGIIVSVYNRMTIVNQRTDMGCFVSIFDQGLTYLPYPNRILREKHLYLSTCRVISHDLLRKNLLLMQMGVSFKCQTLQCFHRDTIPWIERRWCALKMSHAYHCFPCLSVLWLPLAKWLIVG